MLGQIVGPTGTGHGGPQHMTAAEYVDAHQLRILVLAHTAPIYDGVTAPQQGPYRAACRASTKRCQCYTQQGTRMDMADQLCRQLADGGFFVAWAPNGDRVQASPVPQEQAQRHSAGQGGDVLRLEQPAPVFAAQAVDTDAGNLPRRLRRVAN